MNPIILLDEIDKITRNIKGDPSHVLLEILDESQNNKFVDHFLNIPIDLSNCFFIATANDINEIHYALRDRMEIIHIEGYTEEEKVEIMKGHIMETVEKKLGFAPNTFSLTESMIRYIIRNYTRETGVRELQ